MTRRLARALAAALLLAGASAAAQDFPSIGSQYIDYGASMMAVGQMNNVLGSTVQPQAPGGRAGAAPAPGRARAVDTRYRPSPEVSARVRRQFADFAAAQSPGEGVRVRQAVLQKDLLGAWEQHVAVDGLRRGDLADAMTAYWVQNWQIANTVAFTDRAQVQAVRGQVVRALGASPDFARLDDAGKQEVAEAFMLNFVAQGSAFSDAQARGDAALAARLSEAAVARFRSEMQIDLRRLQLTPAGFAPGRPAS
jgi:hypothetical protein